MNRFFNLVVLTTAFLSAGSAYAVTCKVQCHAVGDLVLDVGDVDNINDSRDFAANCDWIFEKAVDLPNSERLRSKPEVLSGHYCGGEVRYTSACLMYIRIWNDGRGTGDSLRAARKNARLDCAKQFPEGTSGCHRSEIGQWMGMAGLKYGDFDCE